MSNNIIGTLSNSNVLEASLAAKNEIKVSIIGTGARGQKGLSAYDVWIEEGNEGTPAEFLESLNGSDGANNYTHPLTHSADMIDETEQKQFVTSEEKLKISGYVHDQQISSKTWVINHPLNKFPSVSVIDTGGNLSIGEVEYVTTSLINIYLSSEFSGKAFLN